MRRVWQRYWFPTGGRWNAGAARIAVATSVVFMLARLRDHALITAPEHARLETYDPAGILMLLGDTAPPPAVISIGYLLAWIAALALLAGVWTRIAAAVALASSLVVVSFTVSFTPEWPHDLNLPLLALLAVQGTRGGDVLGVDGWLRRRRGLPPPPADAYEWTPRLIQVICGLVFLAAFAFKIGHGRGLAWALSDNLRHQILSQFDLNRLPRTALADWLLESVWRYRIVAVLNLCNQLLPIFACALVHRPRLRAVLGVAFLLEVLGIGLVMGLWNPQWMPLAAVFFDWDRLGAWVRRRPSAAVEPGSAPLAPRPRRAISVFVAVFLAYDLLVSFAYPRIDQRLRTYPFSTYPMFAVIRARKPFDQHLDYAFIHGRFHVVGAGARADEVEAWLHGTYAYRKLYRIDDPVRLRERLTLALDDVRRRYPELPITAVQLWACIYHVPAYPAPARLEPHDIGIMGEITRDGGWTTALTRAVTESGRHALALPRGVTATTITATIDGEPTPHQLSYERQADRMLLSIPDGNVVLVVLHTTRADGSPLPLLLTRRTRKAWW